MIIGYEADSPPAEPRGHGQNERIVRARVKDFGGTAWDIRARNALKMKDSHRGVFFSYKGEKNG